MREGELVFYIFKRLLWITGSKKRNFACREGKRLYSRNAKYREKLLAPPEKEKTTENILYRGDAP